MLGWIKDKVSSFVSNSDVAKALNDHFAPLEQVPLSKAKLAERLTHFVITGDGESVVAELAAMQNTQNVFLVNVNYFTHTQVNSQNFLSVLKLLPEDPEVYFRFARVFDASAQIGGTTSFSFAPTIPVFHGSLSWLTAFLVQLSEGGKTREPFFPAAHVSAMIAASGEDPVQLVRGPFFLEDANGKSLTSRWNSSPHAFFSCLSGFADLVHSLADAVRPAFSQKDAGSRADALRALDALKVKLDPFLKEIATLAVGNSKEVREAAAALITPNFSLFKSLLETNAEKGSSDERLNAVRLLARIGGDQEHAFLTARLEQEKAAKVVEAIRDALSDNTPAPTEVEADDFGLTPVPDVSVNAPLGKDVRENLRRIVNEVEQRTADQFARNQFAKNQKWTRTPVTPDVADRLFEELQTLVIKRDSRFPYFQNSQGFENQLLFDKNIPPQFELIHLVRWCLLLSAGANGKLGAIDRWAMTHRWNGPFQNYQKIHKKQINLRELAAVFRTVGIDDRIIGSQILLSNQYFSSPFLRLTPDNLWPYYAERLDLLTESFTPQNADKQHDPFNELWAQRRRYNVYSILKLFPRVPGKLVHILWDIALGSGKTERPLAQECLANFPNKEERILAALASRQQDARLAAAQWLSTLRYTEAIPALRKALEKEKSEVVKDEFFKALESLGVKLEELIDINQLDKEAEKGLKKGIPKDLDWFPFAQLPAVSWEDSGKPVPPEIIQWFLIQGHKLKTAEANPVMRRYCSLFKKDERERLGKFVLESWIAQDTKPNYTPEQAAAIAERDSQQMATYAKNYPQYYPDFDQQRTYQTLLNRYLTLPEESQTATKGILAVAGACCGGDAAPIVHRYVKQWYGYRGAQCKALLQVLAWTEHPSATQVVLSVANRFRTKGIQEEAMRLCQLLADRKGWTLDELADRTIPTVGFDETGLLELDFGPRKFTATLSDEMAIVLTNPSGKTIASLPDPNQSDDPEKAKESKSLLSTARKELKTVLTMQKDRLYESLCTQRTWRFEDWANYLWQHPIVGRYCQRLIWVAYDDDKIIDSFRPLPDGTLTNHQDDEVTLKPEANVRLGHQETLSAEDGSAWLQHFADYKVDPLFQQFGKTSFTLPENMKDETEINDFLGHLVKAFSLRTRLTRLGYTRGAAQDGGWFLDYHKTFLTLGIQAVIEFTGNPLPETNRTVGLQRLYFMRKSEYGDAAFTEGVSLGELPRVLLSECWNDIRMAAAEGSGFAEDWEKQTEY